MYRRVFHHKATFWSEWIIEYREPDSKEELFFPGKNVHWSEAIIHLNFKVCKALWWLRFSGFASFLININSFSQLIQQQALFQPKNYVSLTTNELNPAYSHYFMKGAGKLIPLHHFNLNN